MKKRTRGCDFYVDTYGVWIYGQDISDYGEFEQELVGESEVVCHQ